MNRWIDKRKKGKVTGTGLLLIKSIRITLTAPPVAARHHQLPLHLRRSEKTQHKHKTSSQHNWQTVTYSAGQNSIWSSVFFAHDFQMRTSVMVENKTIKTRWKNKWIIWFLGLNCLEMSSHPRYFSTLMSKFYNLNIWQIIHTVFFNNQINLVCYLSCVVLLTPCYSLYESGSLKVLNGLLTELSLDVVGSQPLDHVDVGGEVPEGLDSDTTQHQTTYRGRLRAEVFDWYVCLEAGNHRLHVWYLVVVLESLGLVALTVLQLSQFGQYLRVSGSHTEDLHQPLDGLLRILQELIAEVRQSRSIRQEVCVYEHLHPDSAAGCLKQFNLSVRSYQQDTGGPAGTWPGRCSSEWRGASGNSPEPPPDGSASYRSDLE